MEFKGKIALRYSREVKRQQSLTTGVGLYVYFLGLSPGMHHNDIVVNTPESKSSGLRLFPRRGEYNLLLDIHIANLLLRTMVERQKA